MFQRAPFLSKWEQNGNEMPHFSRRAFTTLSRPATYKFYFIKWSHFSTAPPKIERNRTIFTKCQIQHRRTNDLHRSNLKSFDSWSWSRTGRRRPPVASEALHSQPRRPRSPNVLSRREGKDKIKTKPVHFSKFGGLRDSGEQKHYTLATILKTSARDTRRYMPQTP